MPHRACEWAMHLINMGRSHSSRRLAGVRGGVGGGETLRASAEFGRDGQSGLGPGRSTCTWHQWVRLLKDALEACLFVFL